MCGLWLYASQAQKMTAAMREISPGTVHMNYIRVLLQHLTQPSCMYAETLISRLSYFRTQMASPTQVLPWQNNCSDCWSDWPDAGSPSACWGRHSWPGHTRKGTLLRYYTQHSNPSPTAPLSPKSSTSIFSLQNRHMVSIQMLWTFPSAN